MIEKIWCYRVLSHSVRLVVQSYHTLCDPKECGAPGFSVHQRLLELAQTRVHQVGDAIQPSHLLSSHSPPAFNPSQHWSFFPVNQFFAAGGQRIGASASASVLAMNIQDWTPLGLTGLILQLKGLSRVFCKSEFKSIKSSALSFL